MKAVNAQPSAGASRAKGKSNDAEATLRKGKACRPEKVETVDPNSNKGLATKLASANIGGNPKKRTKAVWGTTTEGTK